MTLAVLTLGFLGLSGEGNVPAVPDRSSAPAADEDRTPVATLLPRAVPERLVIPRIGVDAPFTDLALDPAGTLEPPPADDVNLVGWYADGASPGERGTSVVAGHVDTTTSPAVFSRLGELREGDTFTVRRDDGTAASFTVDSVERFPKEDFPDDRVYGEAAGAEIRLITCAGAYEPGGRGYTDNLVVFARLTGGPRDAPR